VRLSGQPIAHEVAREHARQHSHVVNDVEGHCDRQAWAAVFALEDLAAQLGEDHGLASRDEPPGGQAFADEIDPLDIACEECGADAGEDCRPLCIAAWQHRHQSLA